MAYFLLKLYVSGRTAYMEQTIADLQRAFQQHLSQPCELLVVDVLENPDIALQDQILATPTLIRIQPPLPRRLIGDLSDTATILSALELSS